LTKGTKRQTWARSATSAVAILALMSNTVYAAESCTAQANDVAAKISDFQKSTEKTSDQVEDDYASASSRSFAQKIFDKFDELNSKAQEASDLVNTTYDLSKNTKLMKEGDIQKSLPPKVTITMSNANELAQAALDDENTKLDIADLRCDQSTEDAALGAFLAQADQNTVSTYNSTKKTACKIVHILADLQDKRQKLNEIRENGYPLFYLHAKEKKSYDGHSRTIQLKVDLRLYPEYPDDAGENDNNPTQQPILLGDIEKINLSYNSYFKWSDNNWTKLNLFQKLTEEHEQSEFCWGKIKITSSVKARLCSRVENISDTSIKVKSRAKFKYNGDEHGVSLGSVTVPAPFGYLADVSDMKESKMEDLRGKVSKKISSLFDGLEGVKEQAEKWQNSCS
jgi:hypothetical protein